MSVHKSWIINSSVSAVLITVICLIGDILLRKTREPLQRAIFDNLTHGLVGFLTAQIIFGWMRYRWMIGCAVLACAIDVDHFIKARSFKLSVSLSNHLWIIVTYNFISGSNKFKFTSFSP